MTEKRNHLFLREDNHSSMSSLIEMETLTMTLSKAVLQSMRCVGLLHPTTVGTGCPCGSDGNNYQAQLCCAMLRDLTMQTVDAVYHALWSPARKWHPLNPHCHPIACSAQPSPAAVPSAPFPPDSSSSQKKQLAKLVSVIGPFFQCGYHPLARLTFPKVNRVLATGCECLPHSEWSLNSQDAGHCLRASLAWATDFEHP